MLHKKLLIAVFALSAFSAALTQACCTNFATKCGASWGTSTSVNLYHCSPNVIISHADIERFISNLCNYLGLTRNSNLQFLYHYAGNGYTSGLSAVQLANGHTDIIIRVNELNNDIYLDFFSCICYDAYDIARRAQNFFGAYDMSYEVVHR